MSSTTLTQMSDDFEKSTTFQSICSELGMKRSKKSYTKKPIKNGEWDRNEVVKFFTCNTIFAKYGIPWKYLIKFVESRTVQQVYNKIKISQEAIKYVNENFWKENSKSDFIDVKNHDKDCSLIFPQIEKKILIFLTQNSKNIFHTKKQKLNAIPKIQKHLFTFSENPKLAERSGDFENKIFPSLGGLCKNISIEICNEDYSNFLNIKKETEVSERTITIDFRNFKNFLLDKNKTEM